MAQLRRLIGGLNALFRSHRVEQELDAELRGFLEAAVEQKMRNGMSRAEASRAARLELGSTDAGRSRFAMLAGSPVSRTTCETYDMQAACCVDRLDLRRLLSSRSPWE